MQILFVTSECCPFIKTGGLADVSFQLPKALCGKGEDVRVIMPKYADIPVEFSSGFSLVTSFYVNVGWRNQYVGLMHLNYEGINFYFIDNEYYFKCPGCYGYYNDGERFTYFCRAVMESVKYIDGFTPDIIHCNDWQTGIIPLYLRDVYKDRKEFARTRSVYTIHNLKYQGVFSPSVLEDMLGISYEYYSEDKMKFYDGVSFMKAGIVYADKITTVSVSYASEIQTPYYGEGLDGLLQQKSDKLAGIINGIDYIPYDRRNKTAAKKRLQKRAGFDINPDIPVFSMVTRLVRQKGIDLVLQVMENLVDMDIQFIILGTGDRDYEEFFEYYACSYPGKIAAFLKFDNDLADLIYKGSDIFLMPSQFEPCGMSQLTAMSCGTLPLVRETGGLRDTVIPYNEFTGEGNGFSFKNYNKDDMLNVIKYAVYCYQDKKKRNKIIRNALNTKFDRNRQAEEYLRVYSEILKEDTI